MRILRRLSATFLTMLLLFNATACQLPQGLMPGFTTSNSQEAEPSHDHSHDHSSEVHEHTFYSHWTYDNSFHWHDASCDHNVRDSYTTHTFSDWKILVEPSETFNGVKERSCKVCNYTVRENIPMGTHTHKPIEGTYLRIEPNCVTSGLIEYDCACGEHIKETLPMLDHNKVYNYECKEDSHIAYIKCEVCEYNEIIEEPHKLEEKIIYEATEYDDGLKIVYCYICGYEKEERIPSFNHKHDYEYYVIKVEPTCQNEGYTRHNCICGDYYDSDIVEKQHSYYSSYDYTPDNHWLNYHCNYCDDKYMDMEEPHKFEISVVREPTEKKDGIYRYSCICGYEYDEIIPSAVCEHDYFPEFNWSNINGHVDLEIKFFCTKNPNHILEEGNFDYGYQLWAWVSEPTCVCEGLATYRGEAIYNGIAYYDYKDFELPADPSYHHYEETVVAPTCEEKGYTIYTCKDCGYSYRDNYVPELGHNFNTQYGHDEINYEHWFVDTCYECGYSQIRDKIMHQFVEEVIISPTEESDGLVRYTCYCGHSYDEVLPMLNHTHSYQPIFTWHPNFAPELEVSFVCSKDQSHILDYSEFTYGFDVLEFINPTCIAEGYISYHGYATYNGVTYTDDASFILPVDGARHSYTMNHVEPTCQSYGYDEYICEFCKDYYTSNLVSPLGHDYSVTVSYNEYEHYDVCDCKRCGWQIIENRTTHNFDIANYYDDNYHWFSQDCYDCDYYFESEHELHNITHTVYSNPTEDTDGSYLDECNGCDYEYHGIIPALGHTHDYYYIVESFDASCEMDGYTRYTCRCGDFYDSDFVPMSGHNYKTTMNFNEFEHYYYDVCLNCFAYQNRDYLPHEFSYNVEVTPTEYYPGLGRYTCYCGYEYSEEIPMLEHTHDYNYDLDTILPTCEQQGYTIYTCSCGDFYIDNYIDALGHDYVAVYSFFPNTDDLVDIDLVCQNDRSHLVKEEQMDVGWYVIEKIEPTCKESGFEKVIAYADYNGMHFETEYSYYPNPLGHNYHIYERVEPNCVSYGYERYYCDCGDYTETILDPIPATGHNLTEISEYNENYHYSVLVCLNEGCDFRQEGSYIYHSLNENIINEPTCAESGLSYVYCTGCEYNSYVEVPAYGHDYQAYFTWFLAEDIPFEVYLQCNNDTSHIVSGYEMEIGWEILQQVDPTCTTEGYIDVYGYAIYDGALYEKYDTYVLTTSGHNYEYNVEVVEATCEENGYTRYTCVCGDYFDSDYVYATGHNAVDGYCIVCGILVPSEGLEYSFNGIEYSVSGLGTCKDSKVVIPEYYNGYPVTSILRGAIHTDNYDTSFINEIILPSTLVTIESSAISASNMRHIMVPESVINYEWDSIYDNSSWPQNTIICFEGKAPESVYSLYMENTARDYVKEVIYENNKQYIITNENYAILSRIYDGDTSIPSEINGYPVTTLGSYVFTNSSITSINLLEYNFTTLEGMCLDGLQYAGIKGTENLEDKLGFGLIKESYYGNEVIITVQENSIRSDWGSYALGYPGTFIKVVYNATLGDLVELEDGSVYAYNNGVYTLISYDFGEEADLTKELVLSDGTILSNYHVAEGLINCNRDLKKVILNNTVTTITENMFAGNIKLESVVLSPSVTKIDSYAFDYIDTLKSISFNGQCGLKEIGDNAFNECINLTSADIFTDIVSIGDYAFYHTGITYFSPSYNIEYIGEYAFAKSRLVEVQFGLQDSLREIGKYAFANCYDMQYFHMADLSTLEVIPENMCYYNSALISVILPDSVIEIGMYAFGNCSNITRLDISSNLVTMGYGVFSSLNGLEGFVLPSSLDASLLIGNEFGTNGIFKIDGPVNLELYDKFASCNNVVCFTDSDYDRAYDAVFEFIVYDDSAIIVSYPQGSKEDYFLTIPDIVEHNGKTYTVKYINPYMFLDYCNFSSVEIPDGIIYIGREAFYNNSSLTKVTLPSSLKYISRCFNNVSEITIPDNIEYMSNIGSYEVTYHISSTFDKDISSIIDQEYSLINYVIDGDNERFELIDGVLVDVELNKIVSGCKSNNIPDGYTTIGDSAYSCLSFSEVIIPEGVEKIDYYAFYGCYNIDKVVIPSTIKEIHTQAFEMALFNENLQIIFNGTKDDFVTIFSEGINNVEYESFWLSYLYCYGMDDYTNVSCIDGILTLKMRGV